jgi:hypothetical protein
VDGRLVPLTGDGLIYARSMVMLDSVRRKTLVPALTRWLLGLGIAATLCESTSLQELRGLRIPLVSDLRGRRAGLPNGRICLVPVRIIPRQLRVQRLRDYLAAGATGRAGSPAA